MNAIVTTTINPPTLAIRRFAAMPDWRLYVVGDHRTPHECYVTMPNVTYVTPSMQEDGWPALSDSIGWDCIQRRNIGFVAAWQDGAEIIASVDDDNIPYDGWGRSLLCGRRMSLTCVDDHTHGWLDPLVVTSASHLRHRGYPFYDSPARAWSTTEATDVLVQADLWDGDPDCDARDRKVYRPFRRITGRFPFTTRLMTVFNSQNTFFDRSVFPHYAVLAHCDRMDDIWGGILLQRALRDKIPFIAFGEPSVVQIRNPHDIDSDIQREKMGERTLEVAERGEDALPDATRRFLDEYRKCFTQGVAT